MLRNSCEGHLQFMRALERVRVCARESILPNLACNGRIAGWVEGIPHKLGLKCPH